MLICKSDSERVANENKNKTISKYKKRKVYKTPSGSIVKKKDAWIKSWGDEKPPSDSIIDASLVDLDPWIGKTEGIDYVSCTVCGFRGKNIKRHVDKNHNLDEYKGPLKSQNCINTLSSASQKTWKKRKE
jgi:Zn ribbon nucleic-acid-binding protein